MAANLEEVTRDILTRRSRLSYHASLLVAISGIDACGKGYQAARLARALLAHGINAITIGVDPWLDAPEKWYGKKKAGELFYRHGIRFADLFRTLVLPLRQHGLIDLSTRLRRQIDGAEYTDAYRYRNVDVIILEGIFLLKHALRHYYDLSIWVECSFSTGLQRALERNQEGLPSELIIRDYQTIYYPAQRIHFCLDNPRGAADHVLINDPRLHGNVRKRLRADGRLPIVSG